jgi:6-phosphofructokinase 1
MAGAADPCLISEHPADIDQLAELLTNDRNRNPSRYAMLLVSEGARLSSHGGMSFEGEETDMFGHRRYGGGGVSGTAEGMPWLGAEG